MNPKSILLAQFVFGLVAIITSSAASLCITCSFNNPLLTTACGLGFISLHFAIAAAACWIVARLSTPTE